MSQPEPFPKIDDDRQRYRRPRAALRRGSARGLLHHPVGHYRIAPFPVHAMRDDVKSGTLRQLPPFTNLPVIDHFLVTNPRLKHTRVEATFLKELTKALDATPLAARTYPDAMT